MSDRHGPIWAFALMLAALQVDTSEPGIPVLDQDGAQWVRADYGLCVATAHGWHGYFLGLLAGGALGIAGAAAVVWWV